MNELKRMLLESKLYSRVTGGAKSVEIMVDSLEEGMEQASAQLGCEVFDLEYEILEEGSEGVFGVGKKPAKILFTYAPQKKAGVGSYGDIEEEFNFTEQTDGGNVLEAKDKDGEAIVRVTRDGIMLTVTPPKGKGKALKDPLVVQQQLLDKEVFEYDADKVNKAVEAASGEPVKIADWMPNVMNDGKVTLDVSGDEMRAFVTVVPPVKSGREVDARDIFDLLQNNSVTSGINEDAVHDMVRRKVFNRPFLVAEGTPAQNGTNARIEYSVDVEKKKIPRAGEDDAVDFKDLHLIENVQVGQVLAEKIPATEGVPGKTIRSGWLDAKDGHDIDLSAIVGTNTELSSDGMKVVSKINGQVLQKAGKICVEEVYEVKGDVGPHTGNITFLGTVVVTGSVLDNYRIDASGNIDIKGSVGKCILEAKGDIYIKLGVNGHLETKDRDGEVNMRVTQEGIMLRVLPARGKGKPLTDTYSVEQMLRNREVENYDIELISKIVKGATGEYIKIAHAPGEEETEGSLEIGAVMESDKKEVEETTLKAGNDIVAKFIQYAHVECERDVVVTEAIMSSYVNAGRRVILVGKKAAIVGGRIRALNEVNGKTLGTSSGTKTLIEVGMAPADRQALEELELEKAMIEEDMPVLKGRISEGEKITNADEERKSALERDKERLEKMLVRQKEIAKQIEEISASLITQNVEATISAAKMICPGVVPVIKTATMEGDGSVRDNFKAVTLYADGDIIQIDQYRGAPQQVKRAAL